jgi:hypothetical protein
MVGFAFEVAQHQRQSVAVRQAAYFFAKQSRARKVRRVEGALDAVPDRRSLASATFIGIGSYPIRRSDRDPMEPRSNAIAALDRASAQGQAHESILESVVYVVHVSHDAPAHRLDHRSVSLHQEPEGVRVIRCKETTQ